MGNKIHNPGEGFCIRLTDETAENRSEDQFRDMIEEMKPIAHKYGFKIHNWGSWPNIKKIALSEDLFERLF